MHLNCGPRGNFINLGYGSLQTSKFELYISKPIGTVFTGDFDKAVDNFSKIQAQKAFAGKCVNFMVSFEEEEPGHSKKQKQTDVEESVTC
ncbi:hypothetical protein EDB87DRAFT_1621890 [Lactarius vividus]|nr:hypothetical protein EDB87DRAFT_1621890 [Lactarius vividus]